MWVSSPRPRAPLAPRPLEALEPRRLLSASPAVETAGLHVSPSLVSVAASAAPSTAVVTDDNVSGFWPGEIVTAYGTNRIHVNNAPATGAGQTIAVVDAYNDTGLVSDLAAFDKKFSLPAASLTVTSQTGSTTRLPGTDPGWARETALDVEWAHATAPGAKLLLVEANSSSLEDLMLATNQARNAAGVSVVSMSWGTSEFYGENDLDDDLLTPTGHPNEVFVAASGDDYSEQWPSSSPNVLSVGGTALHVQNSAGVFSFEKPWIASGGGYSAFEDEPDYQYSVQYSGDRTTPDVSFDADPSTGFAVYDSTAYDGLRGWMDLGGTSAGAPQWAGLVAIADQVRSAAHRTPLNTLSVLNTIYNAADTDGSDNAVFHDVWGDPAGEPSAIYVEQRFAGYGYDLFTGFGSPRGAATDTLLVNASVQNATSGQFVPVSAATGSPQGPAVTDIKAPPPPPANTPLAPNDGASFPPAETEIDLGDIFARAEAQRITSGEPEPVAEAVPVAHVATALFNDAYSPSSAAAMSELMAESHAAASKAAVDAGVATGWGHTFTAVQNSIELVAGPLLNAVSCNSILSSASPVQASFSEAEFRWQDLNRWSTAAVLVGTTAVAAWWWAEKRSVATLLERS